MVVVNDSRRSVGGDHDKYGKAMTEFFLLRAPPVLMNRLPAPSMAAFNRMTAHTPAASSR